MSKPDYSCVTLFVDGSARPNDGTGKGGWAAILIFDKSALVLFGGDEPATNNRMETVAVLEGLRALKRPCMVTICTDSQYVMQGLARISKGKNSFATHTDIWKEIAVLYRTHMAIRVDHVTKYGGDKIEHFHKLCDRYSYLVAAGGIKPGRFKSTVDDLLKQKTNRKL